MVGVYTRIFSPLQKDNTHPKAENVIVGPWIASRRQQAGIAHATPVKLKNFGGTLGTWRSLLAC